MEGQTSREKGYQGVRPVLPPPEILTRPVPEKFRTTWLLIQALPYELRRLMGLLRRDHLAFAAPHEGRDRRREITDGGPTLFVGVVGDDWTPTVLVCRIWPRFSPSQSPHAWLVVEFCLQRTNGGCGEPRTLVVWVALPEIHKDGRPRWWDRTEVEATVRPPQIRLYRIFVVTPEGEASLQEGRELSQRRQITRIFPAMARETILLAEQARAKRGEPPALPRQIWIDPKRTRLSLTRLQLVLYLWQAKLIEVGPQENQEMWTDLRQQLQAKDDTELSKLLAVLRENYLPPDDCQDFGEYLHRISCPAG
jgi:hypothetical protein